MGKSILNTVIDLLNEGGIPAAPAQPEKHMLIIHAPVAAVSIEKADMESATVLVQVVAPIKSGAERCQKRALKVCELLREAGAECVQGKCSFEGRAALFCVPVTAKFYGTATAEDWIPREEMPKISYRLGDTVLEYVTGFSALLKDGQWEFELEEFFTRGTPEPEKPTEPFTFWVGNETFAGCALTRCQRVYTAGGVRQIRICTATSRQAE